MFKIGLTAICVLFAICAQWHIVFGNYECYKDVKATIRDDSQYVCACDESRPNQVKIVPAKGAHATYKGCIVRDEYCFYRQHNVNENDGWAYVNHDISDKTSYRTCGPVKCYISDQKIDHTYVIIKTTGVMITKSFEGYLTNCLKKKPVKLIELKGTYICDRCDDNILTRSLCNDPQYMEKLIGASTTGPSFCAECSQYKGKPFYQTFDNQQHMIAIACNKSAECRPVEKSYCDKVY